MIDIAELRRLEAAATQGEWVVQGSVHVPLSLWRAADKKFIVALRNASPALFDEVEALREEVKALRGQTVGFLQTVPDPERDAFTCILCLTAGTEKVGHVCKGCFEKKCGEWTAVAKAMNDPNLTAQKEPGK